MDWQVVRAQGDVSAPVAGGENGGGRDAEIWGGGGVGCDPGRTVIVEDAKCCLAKPVGNALASGVLSVVGMPQLVMGIHVAKDQEVVKAFVNMVDWLDVVLLP